MRPERDKDDTPRTTVMARICAAAKEGSSNVRSSYLSTGLPPAISLGCPSLAESP